MGVEAGQETSYQWMLRALGAFLDEEPTCRITIAELSDGFLVRLQRALHRLEPQVFELTRKDLVEQLRRRAEGRKGESGPVHHQGVWAHFPNGHQDFFRALGYELDDASAHGILIEEVENGIVVTYSYPDKDSSGERKRQLFLGVQEIEQILNSAFERRQKDTKEHR